MKQAKDGKKGTTMLKLFKISCKSGYSWITPMNATLPEAQAYFGQFPFHVEEDQQTGKETHDTIIKVEEIKVEEIG